MSEKIQEVTPEQQASAAPSLSPEQFETVKRSLIDTLHKHYSQFISSIAHFPLAQMPMQQAFLHFDTGFLWFEKAIVNMPVPAVQMGQISPQSQAPEQQMGQPHEEIPEQEGQVAPVDAA
jgi:hypothetical protein